MAWSSSARLAALNPHATFGHATTADQPKQRNPLLPPTSAVALEAQPEHVHLARTTDFAATIPLAELMQADELASTMKQNKGATRCNSSLAATMNTTLGRTQAAAAAGGLSATSTAAIIAAAALPVRVPPSNSYSQALAAVHAARSERMQRLPSGWSQAAANEAQRRRLEHAQGVAVYAPPTVLDELAMDAAEARAERAQQQRQRARTAPRRANHLSATAPVDGLMYGTDGAAAAAVPGEALSAALNPRRRSAERAALRTAQAQHFWQSVREQEARLASRLAERVEAKHARDEAAFQAMLARLGENQDLLADMDQYLALGEQEGERRRERLYQQWCAQVYEPLQAAVSAGLAARSTSSIEARRQALFDDFLRISNSKKRGLYGDVVIESDYDALAARRHVLRVRTGHLHDPLKASRHQADEEWKLHQVFYPEAQRIEHRVKDSLLPAPVWAKGRIEATPHGRYSLLRGNVQAPVGKKQVDRDQFASPNGGGALHTAQEALDHYTLDLDPSTAQAQFFGVNKGKRTAGYDRDNDPHGYDILASTEPSVRRRFQMRAEADRKAVAQLPAIPANQSPSASPASSPTAARNSSGQHNHFVPPRAVDFVEAKSQE